MSDFKVGDLVELKSSGPEMVVSELHSGSKFECQWFNREGGTFKLDTAQFKGDMLKAVRR